MHIREFRIPVQWGQISVKAWGDERNPPILLLHGISDNSASFDLLIPLLGHKFYYICIDSPGHGKSSSLPPYLSLDIIIFVFALKQVVKYLKWQRYILVGHSWGGFMAMVFTQLYPDHVMKLIILDIIYTFPVSAKYFKQFVRDRTNLLIRLNEIFGKKQLTTYDEAFAKLQAHRTFGKMTDKAVTALLSRALVPAGDGKFSFTLDYRVRVFYSMIFGFEFACEFLEKHPVTCPLLFIMASDSIPYTLYLRPVVKILQKNNLRCFVRKVRGNHDVHMNDPEVVAPLINSFLVYGSSKL